MKKTFLRKLLPLLLVMQAVLLTGCDFDKIREALDDFGIKQTRDNVLLFENQGNNLSLSIDVPTGSYFTTADFELFPYKDQLKYTLIDYGLTGKIQIDKTVFFFMSDISLRTRKNYEITFILRKKIENQERIYTANYKNEQLDSQILYKIDLKFVNIEDPNDVINGIYLFDFSQTI